MKHLRHLFTALLLLFSLAVNAHDFEVGGIYYNITDESNKTVAVTYKGSSYDAYSNEYTGNVVIPESVTYDGSSYSVTSIGRSTFCDYSGLTSIEIPTSVTSIGDYAFYKCSGLTSIEIPNSVTSIGNGAFRYCFGLTSVVIPNSVTSIGYEAFYKCSRLTSIVIGNSVTSIGSYAFNDCTSLKTVINFSSLTIEKGLENYGYVGYYANDVINAPNGTIEGDFVFGVIDGVNTLVLYLGNDTEIVLPENYNGENYVIGEDAFKNNTSITSVVIPNSVTSIGVEAFEGCSELMAVHISDLSAWCNIDFVGGYSNPLYYAKNLYLNGESVTELVIPDDVAEIKDYAFRYCSSLTSIEIPNSVTSIGYYAFYGCSGLTSIAIPNSVTSIRDYAFYECTSLKTVINCSSLTITKGSTDYGDVGYYAKSITNVPNGVIKGDFIFEVIDGVNTLALYFGNDAAVVLPDNYNGENYVIGKDAFKNNTSITSVEIPNSVTSIGEYAFYSCSALTSVGIGNSVTSIGENAFRNCSGLTSVGIPNSVTSIGSSAFSGCTSLKTVINCSSLPITKGYTNYGYVGYYADEIINLPNGFIEGDFIFKIIADVNTLIGYFGNDDAVVLPDNFNGENYVIGEDAFKNNTSITSVEIPNSVTSIGDWAFSGCSALTSVVIGNSVTSIGSYAFYVCSGLTAVHISDLSAWCNIDFLNVTSNPLYYAKKLYLNGKLVTGLVIPDNVAEIKNSAFWGCSGLTSVVIPNSVTSIGEYAFCGCTGLTSVVIPNSVTSIGNSAFDGCSALTSVVIPNSVTSIGKGAFYGCSSLTSVVIPNSVTSIGNSAFYGCSGLTSVGIGNSVTSIGDYAFYECTSLKTVINSSSLTIIEGFSNNGYVGYYADNVVKFPNGVIKGDFIFEVIDDVNTLALYFGNDAAVVLPDNFNGENYVIGKDVFKNNTYITSVVIPNSVTSIGNNAFYGCSGLKKVEFNCVAIGSWFCGNESIKEIVIGNSVTSIGVEAFRGCSGLTRVEIGNSVTSIGNRAFFGCENLKTVVNNSVLKIVKGSADYGFVAYYANKVIGFQKGVYYRLKNVSTGFYMTVESIEGSDMNAGGVKIKSFEFGAQNQIFQLDDIEGDNLKIKSVDGYYLASFSAWGYKATKDENASTTHLLTVTEEGVCKLSGSVGFIGSNNDAEDGNVDGAWVYSNKGSDAQNINWDFEPVTSEEEEQILRVPFVYYDSYDNIEYWSYLKFHTTDQNYLYYNSETPSDVLKTDRNAVDETNEDAYMWAFVGDNISGFKVYNKAAGPSLCLNATSAGAALGTADHLFKVSDSGYAANGFYMQSTNSEYRDRFNKQNGQVVYWGNADSGSTFMLVEGTPYGELSLLISKAETKYNELKNKVVGAKVGVYSQETIDAFESRINEAKALERDEVTKDFVADFQKFVDTPVTAILPEKDKCYVLKSGLSFAETKAVYNDDGLAKWKTFDENDFSFYWKLVEVNGGYALQNLADGKYLRGNSGQSGQWSVTEDIESTNLLNIEVMPHPEDETETTPDEYAIILAGWQMHTAGHGGGSGSAGNVVSWNTDAMKSASAWFIEDAPATCLVEYIYKLDGEVVAIQKKRVWEGTEYPAPAYQAPYGVVIDGALPEGNVAEDKTVEFVLTVEKELPFVAAAEGEPAKWYYLKMHDNPEVSSYIQDAGAEDASIEWVDKSFAAGEQDSHLWGFVGNLWDGFVVVNKATGKAIKSTGNGAATMVEVAEATKFIAWDSKVDEEGWFCLKTPAGNFLNGQDDKVQHYEDNDNGSSFYAYDASLDFNTPELTLSEPVTSLYCVTIEFARENVVNWPDETVIKVCADGEVVESIAKGDAEFSMSGFSFTFGFEIAKDTEVTLEFPDGFSIASIAGEEFTAYDNLKFEVSPELKYVAATPGEPVSMLETITLEFNKKIVLCDNVQAVNIMRGSDVAGIVPVENMRVEDGTYLILDLVSAITPVEDIDILNLTLPAGTVKDANYGEPNEELHLEFNLVPLETITIVTLNYNNDGYDITMEFNTDIVVEWGDIETITVVDVNGTEVTCIRTERATVKNNILTLYLENAIAAEGEYTFNFPEGVVKKNDKVFCGDLFTFENRSKLLYNSHMPAEEVDALKTITVEFTEGIESVGDMTLEVKKDGEVVAEIIPDNTEINGAEVVFTLDKEITEGGTYTVELPEGLVKGISGSSLFDSKVIEFKVSYKCFDVNVTPSSSDVVNELDVIEIEFNDDIIDIAPDAVFDIVDAENKFVTTATASVVGKVVTFVLANPLVNIGTYTLVVADNVIKSVNEACYGGKVFTFDVAKYYSVTYVVDEAVVDKREFLHYEKVTCPQDPEKEGYTFMGWENLPDEMPAEDVVVTAIFEVNSYTVTFMVDGEEYKVVEVEYGARVPSPAAPAREGHKFAGWDGVPSSMPAEDIYVEAKFTVNSYTVTFKVDGKTYKKVTVEYGTEIELPEEPEKVGRTFIGWSDLPESMPAENIVLEAMFEVDSYTVTFMWGDEVYAEVSVEYGAKIELPANPEVEGHTFISWKGVPRTMPAEDVVVTANFKVNSYIVTFMIDGKVYKTMSVQYGAVIEVPEPTKNGYTFDGWSYVPATMPAENITVTGSFTQIETAIDQVLIDSGDIVIYDLNGLRIVDVHELKRGVYIVNGKKTLVK